MQLEQNEEDQPLLGVSPVKKQIYRNTDVCFGRGKKSPAEEAIFGKTSSGCPTPNRRSTTQDDLESSEDQRSVK